MIFNKSKEDIGDIILSVIILIATLYGAYLTGQHKPILIGLIIVCPIISYFYADNIKTIKKAESFHTGFMVASILFCFFMFYQFSHYTAYLDKQFIKGKIHTKFVLVENDNGQEGIKEEKEFKPYNSSDNYKVEIIWWTLFLLNIGSTGLTWYFTNRRINILKEEKK